MGKRWNAKEQAAIAHIRNVLKKELANRPQFPEVVGDRRILRFLRGKQGNVEEATKMYKDFLQWRLDNKVDAVRQDILYGGKDSPYDFPFGRKIIDLAPQIVLTVNSMDKRGQPLSLEQFDFKPKEVFRAVNLDDYLVFLTYTLEYRALVLEQVSHERELAYLKDHPTEADRYDGWGLVIMDYTIRDLKGVGLGHLGSEGRALVAAALKLGLPNYQEYLGNSHMVNVPWVFTTFWYFVKGLLDEYVIAKLTLSGSDYMEALQKEISYENIPKCLGGGFELYNEKYDFDLSPTGTFWYEGCPPEPAKNGSKKAESNGHSGSNSPFPGNLKNGKSTAKDFNALHRTGVHFPSNLTAIAEGSERPSDASSRKTGFGSSSGSSKNSGGVVGNTKRSMSEIWQAMRGAPVFSLILVILVSRLSVLHWELVRVVVAPTVVLFLLLSLLFSIPEEEA